MGEDKEFVFKATVVLQPEPAISEYKGLKLTKKSAVVTEEDIEAHIERMRDRHAKMVNVEEGVVQEDDIAYIDYVGSVDGEEFAGGKGENYPLGIGSDTFIPGFEEQLKGVAVGGDVDVNVTFPEDYHSEDLKGKAALFKVHVNKVQRKELAELTDDFVKLISPAENVENYKKHVEEELKAQAERSANEDLKNQAIEALLANTEVEIPSVMIDDKVEEFLSDINARLSQQGLALDQYLQYIGKTMDELKEEQRPSAEKSVKTEVTLLEIAKKENIEATDVDVDAEIAKVALMTNSKPEDIKARLMESGQFSVLVFSIMLKKAIEFLVENAEIVDAE
ncbi:MAG: trigger factor [Firmicutes bacterium]|nr:trigger factor [Bacillota bacterium]